VNYECRTASAELRAPSIELLSIAVRAAPGTWRWDVPGFCRLDALHGHCHDLIEHVAQPLGIGDQRCGKLRRAHAIDPDHAFVGFFLDDFQLGDEFGRRACPLRGTVVGLGRRAARQELAAELPKDHRVRQGLDERHRKRTRRSRQLQQSSTAHAADNGTIRSASKAERSLGFLMRGQRFCADSAARESAWCGEFCPSCESLSALRSSLVALRSSLFAPSSGCVARRSTLSARRS